MITRRNVLIGLTATAFALSACGNTGTTPAASATSGAAAPAGDQIVITYNSPEKWGNFGDVLKNFTAKTGIKAPNDPKNSGQTMAALEAEKAAPVADSAYVGIAFGDQLVKSQLVTPYKPAGSEAVDPKLKDPAGNWTTVHSGTIAFLVNTDKLGDAPVPTSWADLLKPEYKGKVGYLDPTQAAVGYSVATAVNEALGGNLDDFGPGLAYLAKLKANGAITPAQTATAKVAQGEIPILIDTDFNGYQLRDQGSPVRVVIPVEGSLTVPYVVALTKNAPHEANGKKLLDYYFSPEGQSLFAKGYMRPSVGGFPDDMKSKVLPESDYQRAKTIDYLKQGAVQKNFIEQYKTQVAR